MSSRAAPSTTVEEGEEELTLGFAPVELGKGPPRELPEPTLLATILMAVESDRRDILNRVAAGFEEHVEAVANLYWPFLVVHAQGGAGAAIFDVTGVWKQHFRYAFMPPTDQLLAELEETLPPEEFLGRMQHVVQSLGEGSGLDVLTVEGFLPLNPPLQLDLLSQTSVVTEVPTAHAGFLPARHKVEWYEEEVARMREWLSRLDQDLENLRKFRLQVEEIARTVQGRLELEHCRVAAEVEEQAHAAEEKAFEEISRLQSSHHAEVVRHLEAVRGAHHAVARGEGAITVSTELTDRAIRRQEDSRPHLTRARDARAAIRAAKRQIRDAHRAIETIHYRQRDAQDQALIGVAQIDRSGALVLSRQELVRDHYLATAADLLRAIDQQISERRAQKETLSSYFLPLPTLSSAKIVWLPVWAATLRSPRGSRQIIFPPAKVRAGVGVGGAIKRLFGGTVLPIEPRTVQFDKEFRGTIERALLSDPWLAKVTRELTSAADVLADANLLPRLEEGLAGLKRQGWVSQRQASELLRTYTELLARRETAGRARTLAAESTPESLALEAGGPKA